jgi:hypothetical protein
MKMNQFRDYRLWATLALVGTSPLFAGAKGCHCGADDVPLGTNGPIGPDGGTPDSAGGTAGMSAGGTTAAGGTTPAGGTGTAGTGTAGTGTAGTGTAGTGGGTDCYSPTQNLDTAYAPGSVGCPCDDGSPSFCMPASDGSEVALTCSEGRWQAVIDGPCEPGAVPYAVCGLAKQPGTCENIGEQRFWHNPATGQCEPFQFHCDGNQNNFLTEQECEQNCEVRALISACTTPPSGRGCTAIQPAFYFDPRTSTCIAFDSGGCPTSPNIFYHAEECAAACNPNSATAVIHPPNFPQGRPRCEGHGVQITTGQSGPSFTLDGTTLKRSETWGCGCASGAEFVMLYEYKFTNLDEGPYLELRLCHDDFADSCEALCQRELSWDLSAAFARHQTTRFVFAD